MPRFWLLLYSKIRHFFFFWWWHSAHSLLLFSFIYFLSYYILPCILNLFFYLIFTFPFLFIFLNLFSFFFATLLSFFLPFEFFFLFQIVSLFSFCFSLFIIIYLNRLPNFNVEIYLEIFFLSSFQGFHLSLLILYSYFEFFCLFFWRSCSLVFFISPTSNYFSFSFHLLKYMYLMNSFFTCSLFICFYHSLFSLFSFLPFSPTLLFFFFFSIVLHLYWIPCFKPQIQNGDACCVADDI